MRLTYEVALPVELDPPVLPVLELPPFELAELELATVELATAEGIVPVEPVVAAAVLDESVEVDAALPDEELVDADPCPLDEEPSTGGGSGGGPKHPESRKQRRTALDRHRMGFPLSDVPLERTGGAIWTNAIGGNPQAPPTWRD
jgi:hypothetical protein